MLLALIRPGRPGDFSSFLFEHKVSGARLLGAVLHDDQRAGPGAGRVRRDQADGRQDEEEQWFHWVSWLNITRPDYRKFNIYWSRKAAIGSTRAARRYGRYMAAAG